MVKADDKFAYQDDEGKKQEAEFTNFDLLTKKVEILTNTVNDLLQELIDKGQKRRVPFELVSDAAVYTAMFE